jgi:hypothetical protein
MTPTLEENMQACIDILARYVENNHLTGTSVTNALGEIIINGKKYQIQVRLESDDIIESSGVFETIKIDLSKNN